MNWKTGRDNLNSGATYDPINVRSTMTIPIQFFLPVEGSHSNYYTDKKKWETNLEFNKCHVITLQDKNLENVFDENIYGICNPTIFMYLSKYQHIPGITYITYTFPYNYSNCQKNDNCYNMHIISCSYDN